jgi:hypothetical protein
MNRLENKVNDALTDLSELLDYMDEWDKEKKKDKAVIKTKLRLKL